MRNRYGSSVHGADFWDRSDIVGEIVSYLVAGDSVSLFGLRRIGKSSIMLAVQAQLKKAGRDAVFVDLQGAGNVVAFFESLTTALSQSSSGKQITQDVYSTKALPSLITNFIGRLAGKLDAEPAATVQSSDLNAYLRTVGELIAAGASRLPEEKRPILLLDELPYLLDHALKAGAGAPELEALMAMLRLWRGKGLAMLLSGSIGLHGWTRRHGIDAVHLNDLIPVDLPPLSDDQARAFLQTLAQDEKFDWWQAETTEAVIANTSVLYPALLQFAVQKLKKSRDGSKEAVVRVIATEVRPNHDMTFYRQFDDRIQEYGNLREPALTIIGSVCHSPCTYEAFRSQLGALEPMQQADMELMLREDGFLIISPLDGVQAASPLVTVWARTRGL